MLLLVPTPLGNLSDITLRSLSALAYAEIIFCEDTRIARRLYTLLKERFSTLLPYLPPSPYQCINSISTSSLQSPSLQAHTKHFHALHTHNATSLRQIPLHTFHKNAIYISDAGMPSICDPGAIIVRHCQAHSIPYDVLPGASALTTAWTHSGIEAQGFIFGGFLAHKEQDKRRQIQHLLASNTPIIVYESPHRLLDSLHLLEQITPQAQIFAIKELTKYHQYATQGTAQELLHTLAHHNIHGEWVLIIQASPLPSITLSVSDIYALPLPIKHKSKLLAKALHHDAKHIYKELLHAKSTHSSIAQVATPTAHITQ